jgi:hypothetical protein
LIAAISGPGPMMLMTPAWLGKRLQTCRDVHTVTEDIVILDDHVAEIDANAKPDPSLIGHLWFAVDHPALDLHSTAHGINHAREFRQ